MISKHGSDPTRLPSAHTCFNHLLLPEYESLQQLTARFVTAISEGEPYNNDEFCIKNDGLYEK